MRWFYHVARPILKILMFVSIRCRVEGRANVPGDGPLLIVANHLNLVDPPLLGACLNRPVVFMAKEELFRSRLSGYFVGAFGAFPVHRGKLDRTALRQAERILADGLALVMFPEATRSATGRLQTAYSGAALIALHSGAAILPIGITGTEKMKGPFWMLSRPRVTVNIGRPFCLPPANGRATRTELAGLTEVIMGRIADLLPEELRGVYSGEGKNVVKN